MSDIVFKGFQCLNPDCTSFVFVRMDELPELYDIKCSECDYVMSAGDGVTLSQYEVVNTESDELVASGDFVIMVDDYISEALEFKYCIVCCSMKPLAMFARHGSRTSGRQGECTLCKNVYNSLKNQTRLPDQHREAAQKRRLYVELAGNNRIDSQSISERFSYRCFKCGKDLSEVPPIERPLDHTLPAKYLWPLTTENATLLCREHNGEKGGWWPSDYYSDQEVRRLAAVTGLAYNLLSGDARFNPEAIDRLRDGPYVDNMIDKFAAYMDELIALRNRVLRATELDFFASSATLSSRWRRIADERLAGARTRNEKI